MHLSSAELGEGLVLELVKVAEACKKKNRFVAFSRAHHDEHLSYTPLPPPTEIDAYISRHYSSTPLPPTLRLPGSKETIPFPCSTVANM
jgi:hypothetical protein